MGPFRGYFGKTVVVDDNVYVVVGQELDGRRLVFVLRDVASDTKRRVAITAVLDGLIES